MCMRHTKNLDVLIALLERGDEGKRSSVPERRGRNFVHKCADVTMRSPLVGTLSSVQSSAHGAPGLHLLNRPIVWNRARMRLISIAWRPHLPRVSSQSRPTLQSEALHVLPRASRLSHAAGGSYQH